MGDLPIYMYEPSSSKHRQGLCGCTFVLDLLSVNTRRPRFSTLSTLSEFMKTILAIAFHSSDLPGRVLVAFGIESVNNVI